MYTSTCSVGHGGGTSAPVTWVRGVPAYRKQVRRAPHVVPHKARRIARDPRDSAGSAVSAPRGARGGTTARESPRESTGRHHERSGTRVLVRPARVRSLRCRFLPVASEVLDADAGVEPWHPALAVGDSRVGVDVPHQGLSRSQLRLIRPLLVLRCVLLVHQRVSYLAVPRTEAAQLVCGGKVHVAARERQNPRAGISRLHGCGEEPDPLGTGLRSGFRCTPSAGRRAHIAPPQSSRSSSGGLPDCRPDMYTQEIYPRAPDTERLPTALRLHRHTKE